METAIGLVVGFLGGAFLTIVGAVLIVRLQQERRRLGYEVLTAEVIVPELRPNSGIRIVANKALMDPGSMTAEREEFIPVKKLFGFRVRLQNTGNAALESQRVVITLDNEAKVISAEVESSPD